MKIDIKNVIAKLVKDVYSLRLLADYGEKGEVDLTIKLITSSHYEVWPMGGDGFVVTSEGLLKLFNGIMFTICP